MGIFGESSFPDRPERPIEHTRAERRDPINDLARHDPYQARSLCIGWTTEVLEKLRKVDPIRYPDKYTPNEVALLTNGIEFASRLNEARQNPHAPMPPELKREGEELGRAISKGVRVRDPHPSMTVMRQPAEDLVSGAVSLLVESGFGVNRLHTVLNSVTQAEGRFVENWGELLAERNSVILTKIKELTEKRLEEERAQRAAPPEVPIDVELRTHFSRPEMQTHYDTIRQTVAELVKEDIRLGKLGLAVAKPAMLSAQRDKSVAVDTRFTNARFLTAPDGSIIERYYKGNISATVYSEAGQWPWLRRTLAGGFSLDTSYLRELPTRLENAATKGEVFHFTEEQFRAATDITAKHGKYDPLAQAIALKTGDIRAFAREIDPYGDGKQHLSFQVDERNRIIRIRYPKDAMGAVIGTGGAYIKPIQKLARTFGYRLFVEAAKPETPPAELLSRAPKEAPSTRQREEKPRAQTQLDPAEIKRINRIKTLLELEPIVTNAATIAEVGNHTLQHPLIIQAFAAGKLLEAGDIMRAFSQTIQSLIQQAIERSDDPRVQTFLWQRLVPRELTRKEKKVMDQAATQRTRLSEFQKNAKFFIDRFVKTYGKDLFGKPEDIQTGIQMLLEDSQEVYEQA